MNSFSKIFSIVVLVSSSASASAAQSSSMLTPQECKDYPFVAQRGELTRYQVLEELKELEAVGYRPSMANDPYYPVDIEKAQKRLWAEYARDCTPGQPGERTSTEMMNMRN